MSKLLVDTNLLVYASDEKSEFNTKTEKLLYDSGYEIYTTSKNISEYVSAVTKAKPPVPIAEAVEDVRRIRIIFDILYASELSSSKFEELLLKYKPSGVLIHDYEIVAIGLANGITQIATHNKKDFEGIDEIELISLPS